MRSNEERFRAVKNRAAQIEQKKRWRQAQALSVLSVVSCLAMIVVISHVLPSAVTGFVPTDDVGLEAAGSIFSGVATGYVIVGLLSFVLGTCTTLLCIHLRRWSQTAKEENRGENHDSGAHR